ncbi:MAG TPA: gamma-glutamylcyclotransferase [Dehalococcoidia bacterium]|nr:gamma-glutamylcyclotransferase [Dehalococcoidia bacterium]
MNRERIIKRRVKFSRREHAILEGWRLEFNKVASGKPKEGYANIVREKKGVVEGIIYEIQKTDLKRLDEHEGHLCHYRRMPVRVRLDSGEEVEATTYVAQPWQTSSGLKPSRGYLGHLLEGRDLLPPEYSQWLKRTSTVD